MPRGLIPDQGRRAHAKFLADGVTHGAVGRGTWLDKFNPPLEDFLAAGLTSEIGRVPIKAVRFLTPDPAGTIQFDGDPVLYRYCTAPETAAAALLSLAPSPDVEFEFEIPANAMNGETICEAALFLHSTTSVAGYALPAQVTAPGQLLYLVNLLPDSMYADKIFNRRCRIRV